MFACVGRSRPHNPAKPSRLLARLRADERGFTAVEFGMVAMPFLMLLFGIMVVGLFFFTTFSLENATEEAGRLIRTGQVQQNGMTAAQFKQEVCTRLPDYVDCTNKLRIQVQNFTGFGNIVTPTCIDTNGTLIDARRPPTARALLTPSCSSPSATSGSSRASCRS